MKKCILLSLILCACTSTGISGTDLDTLNDVEIDSYKNLKKGEIIEVYDVDTDNYYDIEIDEIEDTGNSYIIEGFNLDTDNFYTVEIDKK